MNSSAESPSPSSPTKGGLRFSIVFWLLLAGGVALLLLWANSSRGPMRSKDFAKQKGVGQKFDDWRLAALTGDDPQPLTSEETRGKVVLMNFWGTWCPPCRDEFPHIEGLAQRYGKNPGFVLAAVSCGGGMADQDLDPLREETAQFQKQVKSRLPTYADQGALVRQKLMKIIDFTGYPTTVLLDPQGVIRGVWVGYEPGAERLMVQAIENWLPPIPTPKSDS